MPLMLFHTRLQHFCALLAPFNQGIKRAVQSRLHRTQLRRVGFRRRVIVKLAYQLLMQCWKASPALLVESFIASTSAKSCLRCFSIVLTQLARKPFPAFAQVA